MIKVGRVALGAGQIVLDVFREAFASTPIEEEQDDRRIHDSDLVGEYNHRTSRLDAGTDPYGWYDED